MVSNFAIDNVAGKIDALKGMLAAQPVAGRGYEPRMAAGHGIAVSPGASRSAPS